MTRLRENKYVHVSWLSKYMVGETVCGWAPWFQATYQDWQRPPTDSDHALWQTAHTRLLLDVRHTLPPLHRLFVERQADFKYRRESGLVVAGTPDLVALTSASRGQVIDAKAAKFHASHAAQVKIYMHCLPLALPIFRGVELSGRVRYEDGSETRIEPSAINREFIDNFNYFLDLLESGEPPPRVPTEFECRFCSISPADCPERIKN